MEPDWRYLPAPALNLILDKLVEPVDHIWFGAVCKNWRSVAKLNHQNHLSLSKVLPMLVIPTKRKHRGACMAFQQIEFTPLNCLYIIVGGVVALAMAG